MKPILVDQCVHYNSKTHNCNRCGRGLPDVCLEFEEMKRKAEAYEKLPAKTDRHSVSTSSSQGTELEQSSVSVGSIEAPQETKKTRGRRRKVTSEANITD